MVLDAIEVEIFALVNEERDREGLSPLLPDVLLSGVAAAYSRRMAVDDFFSHICQQTGLRSPRDRVCAAGGDYAQIGENIAMVDAKSTTAQACVAEWMRSPGHRANILTVDWEVSGVGVHSDPRGQLFATQLFGVTSKVMLAPPTLTCAPATWHVVRVRAKIGRAHSLCAFLRNKFVGSTDADRYGVATLEVEVPSEPGRHHIGFGRRHRDTNHGWIGVYEGTAEVNRDGPDAWHQGTPAHGGCTVLEESMIRVTGSQLVAKILGRALYPTVCVVDGQTRSEFKPGTDISEHFTFRGGSGIHLIDIGLPESGGRYRVYRTYEVDADAARITTRE